MYLSPSHSFHTNAHRPAAIFIFSDQSGKKTRQTKLQLEMFIIEHIFPHKCTLDIEIIFDPPPPTQV